MARQGRNGAVLRRVEGFGMFRIGRVRVWQVRHSEERLGAARSSLAWYGRLGKVRTGEIRCSLAG